MERFTNKTQRMDERLKLVEQTGEAFLKTFLSLLRSLPLHIIICYHTGVPLELKKVTSLVEATVW